MSFRDILKKSFLEGYSQTQITTETIAAALLITLILSLFIYAFYRLETKKDFYNRSFNVSLVALSLLTAGIILTIQSSVVVSLGMVGALSIVRFRTAIKDPMDLVFLFWSIGVGIMCGAGIAEIAIVTSLVVAIAVLFLNLLPQAKAPYILIIQYDAGEDNDADVHGAIKENTGAYKVKSRTISNGTVNEAIEVRTKDETGLTNAISDLACVSSVSLLQHDGEVTY